MASNAAVDAPTTTTRGRFMDLPGELRNVIYDIVQEDMVASGPYRTSTLLLRGPHRRIGPLRTPTSHLHSTLGPISLAQSCRTVRGEFLPLLMKHVYRIRIAFHEAEIYFRDILLRTNGSVLIPGRKVWTLRIWTPMSYSKAWVDAIDLLPLLKLTAQAQALQPRPNVEVYLWETYGRWNSGRSRLRPIFNVDSNAVSGRDYMIATVTKILALQNSLLLVFDADHEPVNTWAARRRLLESFGLTESENYGIKLARAGDEYKDKRPGYLLGHNEEQSNAQAAVLDPAVSRQCKDLSLNNLAMRTRDAHIPAVQGAEIQRPDAQAANGSMIARSRNTYPDPKLRMGAHVSTAGASRYLVVQNAILELLRRQSE